MIALRIARHKLSTTAIYCRPGIQQKVNRLQLLVYDSLLAVEVVVEFTSCTARCRPTTCFTTNLRHQSRPNHHKRPPNLPQYYSLSSLHKKSKWSTAVTGLIHKLLQQSVSGKIVSRAESDADKHDGRDVDQKTDKETHTDTAGPALTLHLYAVMHGDWVEWVGGGR